jgi:hypothetical protein
MTRLPFTLSAASMSLSLARCPASVRKLESTIRGLHTSIITPTLTSWQFAKAAYVIIQRFSLLSVARMVQARAGVSLLLSRNQTLVCYTIDPMFYVLIFVVKLSHSVLLSILQPCLLPLGMTHCVL